MDGVIQAHYHHHNFQASVIFLIKTENTEPEAYKAEDLCEDLDGHGGYCGKAEVGILTRNLRNRETREQKDVRRLKSI